MTKEMKRPTSNISGNSIKPALSESVEFYIDNNRKAYEYIREQDEYIDYLESKLSNAKPQQALPVVPECVAEFIESYKDRRTIYGVFDKISKNRKTYPKLYEWVFEDENSQATFALAFITGKYEVEKPQLFYLKHIDMSKQSRYCDCYLVKEDDGTLWHDDTINKNEKPGGGYKNSCYKFTQQEIDSMQTGSYELVPVEDEE